ncbi:hypothetical protein [Heyndrickxia oleronia]|nr:hypothetical protein [Heyndrickxia oleronia]
MIFGVTFRQLNTASTAQSKSMEKLSSGLRQVSSYYIGHNTTT